MYEQFYYVCDDGAPDILPENLSVLSGRREEFKLDPWKTFEFTHLGKRSTGTLYCTEEIAV